MFTPHRKPSSLLRAAPLVGLLFAPALAYASPPNDPGFYQAQQAYDLTGTVIEVDSDDILVGRQGLPPAEVDVSAAFTKVTVDGAAATLAQVRPGMAVRVKFQLSGDDVVAVALDAVTR